MVIRRKNKLILEKNIFEGSGTWMQSKLSFILWYYTVSQFSLTRFNLLSCDNSSIFIGLSLQHSSWLCLISVRHGYQTIKWPFKNNYYFTGAFQPKRESNHSTNDFFKNKWKCPLVKGVLFYLLCSTQQQLRKPETKILRLGDGRASFFIRFQSKEHCILCSRVQWWCKPHLCPFA